MTTLHGLVTISELFACFNRIHTGVVNCLILCQNARKMHHSEAKKIRTAHSLDPPIGEGGTSSQNPTPSAPAAPRYLRLRRSTSPKRKSWIRQWATNCSTFLRPSRERLNRRCGLSGLYSSHGCRCRDSRRFTRRACVVSVHKPVSW